MVARCCCPKAIEECDCTFRPVIQSVDLAERALLAKMPEEVARATAAGLMVDAFRELLAQMGRRYLPGQRVMELDE